jgi:hypothetical protein
MLNMRSYLHHLIEIAELILSTIESNNHLYTLSRRRVRGTRITSAMDEKMVTGRHASLRSPSPLRVVDRLSIDEEEEREDEEEEEREGRAEVRLEFDRHFRRYVNAKVLELYCFLLKVKRRHFDFFFLAS